VGLVRGFLAPFRGGAFIARHRLWHYLVLPVLLDVALGVTAMVLASRYWRAEGFVGEQLIKAPAVGWLILVVLTIVSGVVLFLVAQPLLSAVFSDRLSDRVERQIRGEAPSAPLLASAGRAIAHGLLKLVLYALAMLAAFVLSVWTAGIGAIVGLALAGLFIAYDGFDYPLSRRGASFGEKWRYLVTHPAQTIGFGAGATLLYLVPLALFVAPTFVAAGATMVFVESEGEANVKRPGKRGEEKGEEKGAAAEASKGAGQAQV
jgi:CysZ protein